ncbi:MAG: hypothetical protein CMJ64_17710 [Planctomycetaceae bacterium]|nr:hypothetical protein [Planctomycetaceae bacterium]
MSNSAERRHNRSRPSATSFTDSRRCLRCSTRLTHKLEVGSSDSRSACSPAAHYAMPTRIATIKLSGSRRCFVATRCATHIHRFTISCCCFASGFLTIDYLASTNRESLSEHFTRSQLVLGAIFFGPHLSQALAGRLGTQLFVVVMIAALAGQLALLLRHRSVIEPGNQLGTCVSG